MGNFLVVLPTNGDMQQARHTFSRGLQAARHLKGVTPPTTVETNGALVASFSRRNRNLTAVAADAPSERWLVSSGTWLHVDGFGSGDETRLLEQVSNSSPFDLANKLEGFYTIVIGDSEHEAFIITDLLGSSHCFIRHARHATLISTSSLLLACLGPADLDPVAVQEFIDTGTIYEDRTLYRDVRKLDPASVLRFSDGQFRTARRYWDVGQLNTESISNPNAAVETLWQALTSVVGRITKIFPHPTADLTGGYDSRIITSILLSLGGEFGSSVSGRLDSPDVQIATDIANKAHLKLRHFPVAERTEVAELADALRVTDGECDLVEYSHILHVQTELSKHFDISLNGSFGELARGYGWDILMPHTGARKPLDAGRLARVRYLPQSAPDWLFPPEHRLDLAQHFAGIVTRATSGCEHLPNGVQYDYLYSITRGRSWQGRTASSTNQVWPCLSPYMCRSILEVALQIKTHLRRRSLTARRMLAKYQPLLADFPLDHGNPAVPFTPFNSVRFLPLAAYYAGRAKEKLASRLGTKREGSRPQPKSHRVQLWAQEEICELLNPENMAVTSVVDRARLKEFLAGSRNEVFAYDGAWRRLLSLEYARAARERLSATAGAC